MLLCLYAAPLLGAAWLLAGDRDLVASSGLRDDAAGAPAVELKGGHPVPDVGLAELEKLRVEDEHRGGFDRSLFPGWAQTPSCRDVRQQVLFDESLVEPELSRDGCQVRNGLWFDPYQGREYRLPEMLEVDHVVALAEAWESGAWQWPAAWREAYANDLSEPWTLMAVGADINQAKGASDPAQWLPPDAQFRCDYARIWIAVKLRWNLSIDLEEREAILAIITRC